MRLKVKLALALLPAAGCAGGGACVGPACADEEGTSVYDGVERVNLAQIGCCEAGSDGCPPFGGWWLDVQTSGTLRSATLSIRSSAGGTAAALWSELHRVPLQDRDEAGWWEERYLELAVANLTGCTPLSACAERFSPGVATLHACTDTAPETLAFELRLSPSNTASASRCYAWGGEALPEGCEPLNPTVW